MHAVHSQQANIDISPQQNTGIAHVGRQPSDRLRFFFFSDPAVGVVFLGNDRNRHKGKQTFSHTYGSRAWAAAAMRSGEGLVQIDVNHVKTHITRFDFT